MRYLNLSTLKPLFFLFAAIALQGCVEKPGYYVNEQISKGDRDDFHTMNTRVLKYLKANNMDTLAFDLSKDLIDYHGTLRQVELISNQLKTNDYSLLDEYYIVKDTTNVDSSVKINSPEKGGNAYKLLFTGQPGETYVALFLPKTGSHKYLISIEYYKYDYGWKVCSLDLGQYSINNKTAPEYYEMAKEEFIKNYLANAVFDLQMADACLRPSEIWQYPMTTKIANHYGDVINKVNAMYKFPLVLEQVPTHPKIFSIMSRTINDETYPAVFYISTIKLADTIGLKKENENIRKVIGTLIPGIDKDKKVLVYSAYNEMPSEKKEVDYFNMIDAFK